VAQTAERLVGLMRRMPRGDAITWDLQLDPRTRLFMDPADFGEVVGNILDNARKWARSRVAITAVLAGEQAVVAVEDDGPGIEPGATSRILERGEQAHYDGQGSGLGMAIAGDVLAEYGAKLSIAQAHPTGCVVSFTIRAMTAPVEEVP
jgi:signal transduction histidine kinase